MSDIQESADTTPLASKPQKPAVATKPDDAEAAPTPLVLMHPNPEAGGNRTMDLVCPFAPDDGTFCVFPMSPRKPQPTPKEYKLLKVLGRAPQQATKVGCVRCSLFIRVWKKNMGVAGQIRFLLQRLKEGGKDLYRRANDKAA